MDDVSETFTTSITRAVSKPCVWKLLKMKEQSEQGQKLGERMDWEGGTEVRRIDALLRGQLSSYLQPQEPETSLNFRGFHRLSVHNPSDINYLHHISMTALRKYFVFLKAVSSYF
jgi:hypothetical protein